MKLLSALLHDLIDHATPAGNPRAELHVRLDDAIAELGGYAAPDDDDDGQGDADAAVPPVKFATPAAPGKANGTAAP